MINARSDAYENSACFTFATLRKMWSEKNHSRPENIFQAQNIPVNLSRTVDLSNDSRPSGQNEGNE